jgi:putative ABC transport system permease protein
MIFETLREAWRTLRTNPFRTLLTMLSVTIGTFSIVVMLSLAQSGHRTLSSTIESIGGSRLLLWIPSEKRVATGRDKAIYDRGFTDVDLDQLRSVPHLRTVTVMAGYGRESVWSTPDEPASADISGMELGLFEILTWDVAYGAPFTRRDLDEKRRVAILTAPLAENLFGSPAKAVGQTVMVARKPYVVGGVLERRDLFGVNFGFSWTDTVFLPISTAEKREGRPDEARFVVGLSDDPEFNSSALAVGTARLLVTHRGVEDFETLDFGSFLEQFYTFFLALDVVVAMIASVSLFAGGIGVMNIMLVSVSERVKEIGIRKALGASRGVVMSQFLLEAMALSLTGGLVGVGGGAGDGEPRAPRHRRPAGELGPRVVGGRGGRRARLHRRHRPVLRRGARVARVAARHRRVPPPMSVTGFFADLRRHLASALWLARAQKVRFLLTVSGVVVGVASLVTIASLLHVAEGVLESASSQAKGDDLVVVENDWQKLFSDPAARSLDQRDVGDLSGSTLLGATDVAALGRMTDLKAQRDGREFSVKAMGAPPSMWSTYDLPLATGRVFTPDDDAQARDVVVVGDEVDEGRLHVGDAFRVSGRTVTVIGVLEHKPQMGPGGEWGWNNRVLFPMRTFRISFDPGDDVASIAVRRRAPAGFTEPLTVFQEQTKALVDDCWRSMPS